MNEDIIKTIKKYEKPGDFTYAKVTDEMISNAENRLEVRLPDQYVEFLKKFGHGGICGIEVLGVGKTGRMIFLDETIDYRGENLPNNLVVIENVDEWLICIDCSTGKVVSWDDTGYIKEDYASFDSYLVEQMNEAIENI